MATAFNLQIGYVESAQTAHFILSKDQDFKTTKEAFVDLVKYLHDKFLIDYEIDTSKPECKPCCKKNLEKKKKDKFCSGCGAELDKINNPKFNFDLVKFADFISEIAYSNADSYGSCYGYGDNDDVWTPWGYDFSYKPIEIEKAEIVIAYALGQMTSDYPDYNFVNDMNVNRHDVEQYNTLMSK